MSKSTSDWVVSPQTHDKIISIDCPNSYYNHPRITHLGPTPPGVWSTLSQLWNRSVHAGRNINIYRFTNVIVVKEGLVFDTSARLIDCTRTYHSDTEVEHGRELTQDFINTGLPSQSKKGVLAKSRGAENYGHFIIEMLPRVWLARRKLKLSDWPAIVYDRPNAVNGVSLQALHAIGFSPDQILTVGPEPMLFKELIFVDGLTFHAQYLSPFVMQCLDAVSENVQEGQSKQIYALRRPTLARDFANETRIAERLRHIGFQEKETARMTFVDQISTFKGAQTVVGVMGAALANIAFCRPGTDIVVFVPSGATELLFWMLAEARRLRYHEVRCSETGPQIGNLPWDRQIEVSADEVERVLSSV